MLVSHRVLLIIGGGIAAYKCLELVRRAREQGIAIRAVMTRAAREFVTPLSVGALTNDRVFTELFDLDDEREIGHIRLSREADLIVVAPATADLVAKMAGGHADDLASAVLLATDKPVLIAPAMNPRMWQHPATARNIATLRADGVAMIGPNTGEMAERGEVGPGRMAEPGEILDAILRLLAPRDLPLSGRRALVTAGPTHEPIDPVRYIANRSSGKQGYAIAAALADLGADVTLVSGPTSLVDPKRTRTIRVETAREMLAAVEAALPADVAVFAAAVADWRVASAADEKIKKTAGASAPTLSMVENPDILKTIAGLAPHTPAGIANSRSQPVRPRLVVGFAAETENVLEYAAKKRIAKGCDWLVANDVSPEGGVMGGDRNTVHLITGDGVESWTEMPKADVARRLAGRIARHLGPGPEEIEV